MPEVLYKYVIGIKCRVIPALPGKCLMENQSWRRVKGSTGEDLFVTQELDETQLKEDLKELRDLGIESLAVVLAHSYTFVNHSNKNFFAIFFRKIFSVKVYYSIIIYIKPYLYAYFNYAIALLFDIVMRIMKSESAN